MSSILIVKKKKIEKRRINENPCVQPAVFD